MQGFGPPGKVKEQALQLKTERGCSMQGAVDFM